MFISPLQEIFVRVRDARRRHARHVILCDMCDVYAVDVVLASAPTPAVLERRIRFHGGCPVVEGFGGVVGR